MAEKEPINKPDNAKGLNNYAKFTSLAFQMVAIIGGFTYAGFRIDKAENHQVQWVTIVLALIGVFISLYTVFRAIKD